MSTALSSTFGGTLPPYSFAATWNTFSSSNLNGSTVKMGWVFQAVSADAITALGFRHNSLTGTPPTYIISIQGVSTTTKYPNGTIKGGGTPASATFTPTGGGGYGSGTWHWITLDNSYTPARGEWLSVVIEHSSGSVDTSNFSAITYGINNGVTIPTRHTPYAVFASAGTFNSSDSRDFGVLGIKAGSSVLCVGDHRPILTGSTVQAVNSPTEAGMTFTIPSGWCDTYKVAGIRLRNRSMSTGSNYCVTLYSGPTTSATVLQQIEIDSDNNNPGSNVALMATVYFDEATLSTLTAGTKYAIGVVARDVATDYGIYYLTVDNVADWDGWPFGQQCSYAQRTLSTGYTSTGTVPNETTVFTETTTRRVEMELILDDITEPAGGGGGGPLIGGRLV